MDKFEKKLLKYGLEKLFLLALYATIIYPLFMWHWWAGALFLLLPLGEMWSMKNDIKRMVADHIWETKEKQKRAEEQQGV